ncbi:glycosyltransferase [Gordonia sp. AC31]|uniref:glycosyltransferase n=1 Tax=Gordonia sp. AC31 TaxID=2962571 RepID=UPI002880C2DA|nr:glycosyltransferase [Gordonia sp. AC31]MDT0223426.1 glycosyltransferase [Gordonia sp. AC31]
MKILLCLASVHPDCGGPTTAAHGMADSLARAGHYVTTIAHDDGDGTGLSVREVSSSSVDMLPNNSVVRFKRTTNRWQASVAYASWIVKNVRSYDAVVVHSLFLAHTQYVARTARFLNVPYAIRPHGSLNEADIAASNSRNKRRYIKIFERGTLNKAQFIFCTSESEAEGVRSWTRTPANVIPLGVTTEQLKPSPASSRDRSLVCFVGRVAEKKGLEILVEALPAMVEAVPDVRVVIAGPDEGGRIGRLQDRLTQLGVARKVEFPGFLGPAEKQELYRKAGVFVLPSRDENFGISTAEALYAGLPVVISRGVSHAGAVQESGAGVVVERDPSELSAAVVLIATEVIAEYSERSRRAHELASTSYSWDKTCAGILAGFELNPKVRA